MTIRFNPPSAAPLSGGSTNPKPWQAINLENWISNERWKTGWWFQIVLFPTRFVGKWSKLTSIFFRWVETTKSKSSLSNPERSARKPKMMLINTSSMKIDESTLWSSPMIQGSNFTQNFARQKERWLGGDTASVVVVYPRYISGWRCLRWSL